MHSAGMIDTCLSLAPKHSLKCAAALNIKGPIEMDLGNSSVAVGLIKEGLRLRELLYTNPDNWGIAASMGNLALAYMEMGDVDLSLEYHNKALGFRKRIRFERLGNSYFNLSALMVRMGKPEDAEEMYRKVPGIGSATFYDLLDDDKPRTTR